MNIKKALLLAGALTGGLAAVSAPSFAEDLPWANKPLEPQATAPAGTDQAAVDAAASQCASLFEAACRDLKTCSWVAEIALKDGTTAPARCVARPPAPPKAAKKQQKTPAKKEAAAKTEATPAAVKAEEPAKPKETKAVAEPAPVLEFTPKAEKAAAPASPEQQPVVAKKEPAPKAEEAKPAQQADAVEPQKTETKSPVVVTPPKKPEGAQMPSFGSISPIMPGGESNAVVVTVPSSQ